MDAELVARALTTLPDDDTHPYRTGAWRPQSAEWNASWGEGDLEIEGRIPTDLDGVYLRNTENPAHPAVAGRYHPFDGDGMLHGIAFQDGRASYHNRFVRTEGFEAEQIAKGPLWSGLAEHPEATIADHGWGARGGLKDSSSTDVVVHAGHALSSFYQCGELYRLDPLTLDTLGTTAWSGPAVEEWRDRWGGAAFPPEGVSAHTKVDEATGELLFFNYSKAAPFMHYGVVDAENRLVHYTEIPLPGPRLPHDMAFTEHYAILNDFPLHWDTDLLDRGLHAARLHDKPSRFAIIPRRGTAADVRWFETDPTYVLHWTNAWEEGDEIVLEGFFQHNPEPNPDKGDKLRIFRFLALDYMETRLHRWRFNLVTGEVREESLREEFTEFGMINPLLGGRRSRYIYAATGEPGWFLFDGLVKHDTVTGADEHVKLPKGVFCSETIMAPRTGSDPNAGDAEDDGYLVTFTMDTVEDRSECLIFDASAVTEGPVARIRLPERISSGTHATWAPGSAIPDWARRGPAAVAG